MSEQLQHGRVRIEEYRTDQRTIRGLDADVFAKQDSYFSLRLSTLSPAFLILGK